MPTLDELTAGARAGSPLARRAAELEAAHGTLPAADVLRLAIREFFPGEIALVSSFGAESAVLLHLAAEVDRALPVVFVDTGRLFPETLAYRDALVARLGLTGVRTVGPDPDAMAAADPYGALFSIDADRCCALRKVQPLAGALKPFTAWITGRKRFQAATRATVPVFEADATHIKVTPLAAWGPGEIAAHMREHGLPAHPLVAKGFLSIGCAPCTTPVEPGEDPRAGRWRGSSKTECGIHIAPTGVTRRSA
ncbi:phosphoadenylyl-sulfate reductase [Chelatococcus sp. SYSU_G07232]|uniref:Adenosine 5'-phosphosulfate reductase n=1 Tax=Chelatococcus albus TaxID=3047466 RepID=A0ABT7AFK0_9HYPH|nr:phosphoadenylyl-sulfate reductase [Chelatococcus sp. SYSU_G07232]MDJ1158151.1 phosphoadenylyl-sulfate reductase [Chelatococcus sp. SYSU_G07232]